MHALADIFHVKCLVNIFWKGVKLHLEIDSNVAN